MLSSRDRATLILLCNAGSLLYSEGPYLSQPLFRHTRLARFVTSTHNLGLRKFSWNISFSFYFWAEPKIRKMKSPILSRNGPSPMGCWALRYIPPHLLWHVCRPKYTQRHVIPWKDKVLIFALSISSQYISIKPIYSDVGRFFRSDKFSDFNEINREN